MNRNREFVLGSWSLVKEKVLTTGLCAGGLHSQYPCIHLEKKTTAVQKACKSEGRLNSRLEPD